MPEDKNEQSGNPRTQSAAAGAQTGNQGQSDQKEQGLDQEKDQPGGQTGQGGQGSSQQNYQGGGGQQGGGRQEPAPTTQQDKERERQ